MKTNKLLLLACLFFTPAAHAYAQEEDGFAKETDFTLHRYSPEWVDSDSLVDTMQSLYGRVLEFDDRSVKNLTMLGDSIVIYETEERMSRILNAIATLDSDPDQGEHENEETASYNVDDMVIKNYSPTNMNSSEFYSLALELYGEDILVGEEWHSNLRYAHGRGIIVFEVENQAQDLINRLTELDQGQSMVAGNNLVMMKYHPRFVSPTGLIEGIQSYQASVYDSEGNNSRGLNISIMKERGILVIRDREERAMEIMHALEQLDQPLPQTMMVCQVIMGTNEEPGENSVRASQEVEQQLKQILPHKYYTVSGSGMLRTGVAAGTKLELFMDQHGTGSQWQYQLAMKIGSHDSEQGSLSLNECQLSLEPIVGNASRALFRTSTTIYKGEYAVLGVTGAAPLFLVVQLMPIETP